MRHVDVALQRDHSLFEAVTTTACGTLAARVLPALRLTPPFSLARRSMPRAIGDIGDLCRLCAKSQHVQRFDAAPGKPMFVCGAGAC
jgi:hypothetical protein